MSKLRNLDIPIIHRDVKTSNIVIGRGGEVYLLDVNVAKMKSGASDETTKLIETMYYVAPEQFGYGLEPEKRYTALELADALDCFGRELTYWCWPFFTGRN